MCISTPGPGAVTRSSKVRTGIGQGTGRFAHINGSGTYAAELLGVLVRNARGKCSQSRPPRALQQVVTAHGPVRGA